jgi:hypothetical protein
MFNRSQLVSPRPRFLQRAEEQLEVVWKARRSHRTSSFGLLFKLKRSPYVHSIAFCANEDLGS